MRMKPTGAWIAVLSTLAACSGGSGPGTGNETVGEVPDDAAEPGSGDPTQQGNGDPAAQPPAKPPAATDEQPGTDPPPKQPAAEAQEPKAAPPPNPDLALAAGDRVAAAQITSVPPTTALLGQRYTYTPEYTLTGAVGLELIEGPPGMSLVDGRRLEWDTSTLSEQEAAAPTSVVIQATSGDQTARQQFELHLAVLRPRAFVDASPSVASQVVVTAPTSAVRGAAVQLPAGALSDSLRITVNEVDNAPAFPNQAAPLQVVDFGPSGTSFSVPATVALPFDAQAGNADPSRMGAYTYDPRSGSWEPIEVLSVDLEAGLLYAQASHFSIYAAAEVDVAFELGVTALPESACDARLAVSGELREGLRGLSIGSVNGLSESMRALEAADVRGLVEAPGFVGSLRFVRVLELYNESGRRSSKLLVSTVYAAPDGSATLVHTDSFGNLIASRQYDERLAAVNDIDEHLSGLSTHSLFDAEFGAEPLSVAGRLHVIYSESDQSLVGAAESSLGAAAVSLGGREVPEVPSATSDFDADCDRFRGGYDQFDDSLVPRLEAAPQEASTLLAGSSLRLSAWVVDANADPSAARWALIAGDESAQLRTDPADPLASVLTPSVPGFYTVGVQVDVDATTLERRFNVLALPVPAQNEPPTCRPTALVRTVSQGTATHLFAALDDRETPNSDLKVEWGLTGQTEAESLFVPTAGLRGEGELVTFLADSAGSYRIGCRAFDGSEWGPVESTLVEVVAPEVNLPPDRFTVSPATAQVVVGERVRLRARAEDPEGEALLFEWVHPFDPSATVELPGGHFSVDTVEVLPGQYSLLASVSDGQAPPQLLPVLVRVLAAPLAPDATDADSDGFPASLDCNDQDPAIHPDARDVCGNEVDEDCDGEARDYDCDYDGAAVTDAEPDCDDSDSSIHPGATERCDNIDNDCDSLVDEDFAQRGNDCSVGTGSCASEGLFACSADGTRLLCSATPVASGAEWCDGRDNDCDGEVDDDAICSTEKVGFWVACRDEACFELEGDVLHFAADGQFRVLKRLDRRDEYAHDAPACEDAIGSYVVDGRQMTVRFTEQDGQERTVYAEVEALDDRRSWFAYTDPETGEWVEEAYRRVPSAQAEGPCPNECEFDDDGDGIPNCEDPCPGDRDNSCDPAYCDAPDGIPCEEWCALDDDGDDLPNCQDPCPDDPNWQCGQSCVQADGTPCPPPPYCNELTGEGCDPCLFDDDGDGIPNCEDPCPRDADPRCGDSCVQADGTPCPPPPHCDDPTGQDCDPCLFDDDGDGIPNCQDPCPGDRDNSCDPAYCDAPDGIPCEEWCALDDDGDGIPNCEDPCPENPDPQCGYSCVQADGTPCPPPPHCDDPTGQDCDPCLFDDDGDGIPNCEDPCPGDPENSCDPAYCDAPDGIPCEEWCALDDDGDGTPNCEDPCPENPDPQCGYSCMQPDGTPCPPPPPCDDPTGQDCDPCLFDDDGDGIPNCEDPCPGDPENSCDPAYCDAPDGIPCEEWCALDDDGDGTPNCEDPCPENPDPQCGYSCVQPDGTPCPPPPPCDDPTGQDCDPCLFDDDGDGIPNCEDPCPGDPENSCDPAYCDAPDGIPCEEWCALDDDGDGTPNCEDPCPENPDPQCGYSCMQPDGTPCPPPPPCDDPTGQNCDPCLFDDDGDGIPNCEDPCPGDPENSCDPAYCDAPDGIPCEEWCALDDDGDGALNCEDPCPLDESDSCDATTPQ